MQPASVGPPTLQPAAQTNPSSQRPSSAPPTTSPSDADVQSDPSDAVRSETPMLKRNIGCMDPQKATVRQFMIDSRLKLQDKVGKKAPPIPDDPLSSDKTKLEEYQLILKALMDDVQRMTEVVEAMAAKERSSITLRQLINKGGYESSIMESVLKHYTEGMQLGGREHYALVLEQLQFEVKAKLQRVQGELKKFSLRDRLYRSVSAYTEEVKIFPMRKVRGKLQQAQDEFDTYTQSLAESIKALLDERSGFLAKTIATFVEMQTQYYNKASKSLQPLCCAVRELRESAVEDGQSPPVDKSFAVYFDASPDPHGIGEGHQDYTPKKAPLPRRRGSPQFGSLDSFG